MQELAVNEENTIAIMLPGRAGAVEGDFTVYHERAVAGALSSTNITADITAITESPTAPGLFYVIWTPTTEQLGGALVLKHTASGDCAAESISITRTKTMLLPKRRRSNGSSYDLWGDGDDLGAAAPVSYARTSAGTTETFTRS